MPKKLSNDEGVSMFEMIIALFIVAIILTAIATLATISIRNNSFAVNKNRANNYAQEAVDWLRGLRDTSYSNFYLKAAVDPGQTWCLDTLGADLVKQGACDSTEPITDTFFYREARLIQDASEPNQIESIVTVTWEDGQGQHIVNVITNLTNWAFLP